MILTEKTIGYHDSNKHSRRIKHLAASGEELNPRAITLLQNQRPFIKVAYSSNL